MARVKLATELSKKATGRTMYILDEPTTGLHFDDVNRLVGVLQALVDLYDRGFYYAGVVLDDNDLPIVVFKLEEPGNMKRALVGEEIGTLVGSNGHE